MYRLNQICLVCFIYASLLAYPPLCLSLPPPPISLSQALYIYPLLPSYIFSSPSSYLSHMPAPVPKPIHLRLKIDLTPKSTWLDREGGFAFPGRSKEYPSNDKPIIATVPSNKTIKGSNNPLIKRNRRVLRRHTPGAPAKASPTISR